MVNDLAHGHTAKDGAEKAALPAMAMGAVDEGQAQVTGEISPLSKQGCLKWQRPTEKRHSQVNGEYQHYEKIPTKL